MVQGAAELAAGFICRVGNIGVEDGADDMVILAKDGVAQVRWWLCWLWRCA